MRKAAGFEIEERIVTYVLSSPSGEGTAVRPPLPTRGEGWGEGTAVRPPLPTRGEGWGEGTGRGEAGTVDEEGQSEAPALPPALASQEAYIRQETLSDALHAAPPPPGAYTEEHEIDGATLTVGVVRAR